MNSNPPGGIGRAVYLGAWLALLAGAFLIGLSNPEHYLDSPATALLLLASLPLSVAITAMRLTNIGENPWLAAVPFLSFILMLYCLTVPPGYRQHKQMDTVGGAIVAAIAAAITIVITMAIFG